MKWSPWPSPSPSETRKFNVKAYGFKLQGFNMQDTDSSERKYMVLAMKIRRPCNYGIFPFRRTDRKFSREVLLTSAKSVEWNQEFDAVCSFSVSDKNHSLRRHRVSFTVLYGDGGESKAKPAVLGKVSLNLEELASKTKAGIQRKLPISLRVAGAAMEATLSVSVSFMELRNAQDAIQLGQNPTNSDHRDRFSRRLNPNANKGKMNQEVSTEDSDESALYDSDDRSTESSSSTESGSSRSSGAESDPDRGTGSWERRRLGFTPARTKVEPLNKNSTGGVVEANKINCGSTRTTDPGKTRRSLQSNSPSQKCNTGSGWEVKEVESRDGQAKLKASVFFASFDQCSAKAAGESACAALVAVVAHWLNLNQHILPTRSQLDNLITQGSSEWRNLCNNANYRSFFPDKHFDLETVLKADLRPLSVSLDKSFVGFFSPEKLDFLKGVMSFDQIWKEINRHSEEDEESGLEPEPRVYIVSWNDHFFVLKVDKEACYIIDSLGKRLFDGCDKAFILKFDDSAVMYGKAKKYGEREVISTGKECCREFIKRFLAAIPVREVEVERKKGTVSHFALYQRLQIDFHFTSSLPSSIPTATTTPSASSHSPQMRSRFSFGSKAA